MVTIPRNNRLNAVIEFRLRLPAEFPSDLGRIDGIAAIVPLAIRDVGDLFLSPVQNAQDRTDDIDIGSLIVPADVIDRAFRPTAHNRINGTAVIVHMQPVTDILSIAIDGKLFPLHGADDHERDQFFGELECTVVIGTA